MPPRDLKLYDIKNLARLGTWLNGRMNDVPSNPLGDGVDRICDAMDTGNDLVDRLGNRQCRCTIDLWRRGWSPLVFRDAVVAESPALAAPEGLVKKMSGEGAPPTSRSIVRHRAGLAKQSRV